MKNTGERILPENKFYGSKTKSYLEHAARYKFASNFVTGKKVLDVACGVGYGSKILHESGATEVYGCDISEEAISYARKNFQKTTVSFKVDDVTHLTFPENYFDCIVSFETIEHIKEYEKVIKEFNRVLKDNGLLIISTPNREMMSKGSTPKNPFHVKEFTKEEFVKLLSNEFVDIDIYSQLLPVEISLWRRIFKNLVHAFMRIDVLKLYRKILSEKMYVTVGSIIDDTNHQYNPIPYQYHHNPYVFVATCKKNS